MLVYINAIIEKINVGTTYSIYCTPLSESLFNDWVLFLLNYTKKFYINTKFQSETTAHTLVFASVCA